MAMAETGYAKLNLALHVRRREPDGYHAIETLFVFAEDGDRLAFSEEPGLKLTGEFAGGLEGGPDNLVLRAARGFAERFGYKGKTGFHLDKRLPVAAGIGGGSADAGAALRLLCRRYGIDPADPRLTHLAVTLGADVPACLFSRPMRGLGRGDRLVDAEEVLTGMPVLLVNPRLPLSTAAVFMNWDSIDRGPLAAGDALGAAGAGRNDLEGPAIEIIPTIAEILTLLRAQPDVILARMSGSGATCFALFQSDAARDGAARAVEAAQPGWWRLATRLR
jgi:4-diphosphocytidyl-2-C-methyl-D-erythritol kinase